MKGDFAVEMRINPVTQFLTVCGVGYRMPLSDFFGGNIRGRILVGHIERICAYVRVYSHPAQNAVEEVGFRSRVEIRGAEGLHELSELLILPFVFAREPEQEYPAAADLFHSANLLRDISHRKRV